MKIVTFKDIESLGITASTCYEWAEKMIANKNNTMLPAKVSLRPSDGAFCNILPSMLLEDGTAKWGGVKVVTRYSDRKPSLESRIFLMDAVTGKFLALMDGTWITTMRTGAVATHSVMLFARKEFSTIGIMGLGNVARSTLLILCNQMPDREFHIKLLRYKDQAENFANRFKDYKQLHFSIVDTPEDMVKGSEVVLSGATYLPYDVCEDKYFEEGVLVQPIHTLGFTNCDLFFDKAFVDDIEHVRNFRNFDKFKKIGEVCDVVNGRIPGREDDNERILAYNIGLSIHDINYAVSIYKMMDERGMLEKLPSIDMEDPTVKFWV